MSFLKKLLSAIFPSTPTTVVSTVVEAPAVEAVAKVAPVEAPVEDVVEAAIKKPRAPRKPKLNVAK
jgi:hypothetical protein